jgi:hypothetical protein
MDILKRFGEMDCRRRGESEAESEVLQIQVERHAILTMLQHYMIEQRR